MVALSVALAVLAAAGNATSSVLQRKAARREPDKRSFSLRLMWDLAHQPVWIGGILAVTVAFLLQAVALGVGQLSTVQPLLVLELPFALMLASIVFRAKLHLREWASAAGMSLGLALFLYSLSPTGGDPNQVAVVTWVLGLVVTLVFTGVFVWLGRKAAHARRAAYLAVATGIMFGLTAALINGMAAAFDDGLVGVMTTWQTYLVMVFGPASMFLLQNTLQAGTLVAAQPGLTLTDPVVAVAWGITIFSEQVRTGPWLVATLIGAGVITASTILLARSPLLHGRAGRAEETG